MSHKLRHNQKRKYAGDVSSPLYALTPAAARPLLLGWLIALVVARWWLPTEGSAEGLTLWLVPVVLLTAVTRGVWKWKNGIAADRFEAMDAALLLLIGAQVVSALAVVFGVGNARAAINVAWEWIGCGVLIWMFRRELHDIVAARELCFGIALAAAVLAGYGLWQHFVWYPEMIRDYKKMAQQERELLERVSQATTAGVVDEATRQLNQLRGEFAQQNIPSDPGARLLWEQRLKNSREPIGLFALANSLAGLLLVAMFLQVGLLESLWGDRCWRGILIGLVLVTGYCLLLTKSRTAHVAAMTGAAWWGWRWLASRRLKSGSPKKLPMKLVAAALIVGLGVTTAAVTGGLDSAVLSEATKSLTYRLEYWQSTLATILEQPWLGTGPGNFRDHYLKHKLPASSEEIADPHNLVLDVWANAGTIGLIGLLSCVALMAMTWLRPTTESVDYDSAREPRPPRSLRICLISPAVWGTGLSFSIIGVGLELFGFGTDERVWVLGLFWWLLWIVAWLLSGLGEFSASDDAEGSTMALVWSLEAANIGLLVHLLGAGGIAMPAITQALWLMWMLRRIWSGRDDDLEKSPSSAGLIGVGGERRFMRFLWPVQVGFMALMTVICFFTAIQPEVLCRTHLAFGDSAMLRSGQSQTARNEYLLAVYADRWSVEPHERLAELSFREWTGSRRETDFDAAIRWQHQVADQRPLAVQSWRRLGEFWLERFELSHDTAHAALAAAALQRGVERYPHHSRMLADLAIAYDGAEQVEPASSVAAESLRQDDLNRRLGHTDKLLHDGLRQRLTTMSAYRQKSATSEKPN